MTKPENPNSIKSAKAQATKLKLIQAGCECFASNGYAAASTRQIETSAGVQRNLISYHFGNKEKFWKTCADYLCTQMSNNMKKSLQDSKNLPAVEQLRFFIRTYIDTSAANPAINRIMVDEGKCNDWRLQWLVENHVAPFYQLVSEIFTTGRQLNVIADIPLISFYYTLVSSVAMFSMAPECKLLTGKNPLQQQMIDNQAKAIAALLIQEN